MKHCSAKSHQLFVINYFVHLLPGWMDCSNERALSKEGPVLGVPPGSISSFNAAGRVTKADTLWSLWAGSLKEDKFSHSFRECAVIKMEPGCSGF